jgi:uncharacterized protein (TIGR00106 family)
MASMEIAIEPVGTDDPHMGSIVAGCVNIVAESGLEYRVGAMGTVVQGTVEELLELAGKVVRAAGDQSVPRVLTTIRIDDVRVAREHSLDDRVRIVESQLSP